MVDRFLRSVSFEPYPCFRCSCLGLTRLLYSWPPQAGSRTSWNYDMTSYAAKRLLHMVDDTPLDSRLEQASVTSDSKQSVLSEVTWKSSHPVRPESPTLTRANSDLSLYAPIRRTSMIQVPGVATRRNSNSSHISAGGVSMRPTFRHSHPATTPSLSRKSSFESTGSRVQSMPPPVLQRPDLSAYRVSDAKERVSTPCEGDYNAIGAFKLGSLRITNGAASPMSSPARTRKVDTDKDEPAHSSDSNATARTEALAALSGTSSSIDKDNDVPPTPRSYTAHEPEVLTSHHRQLSSSPFASPPNTIPATQPLAVKSLTAPAQEKRSSPATLPKIELPEDLFAGFEFNAFSFEEASSLETSSTAGALQTTSKTTAVEDRLFEEDEVSTSGYAFGSAEVLDVRLDPSAKRSQRRKMASILVSRKSAHSMQSVSRSDSGFVSSPTSETSRKPLSKADSGYSSNVSLRSFKHAASKLMAPVAKAANRLSSDRDSNARLPERESFLIDELKLPSPTFDTPDAEMHALSTNIPQELRRKPLPSIDLPPPISALEAPQRPPPPPPPPSRGAPGLAPENYSLPLSPVSVTTTDVSTPAASEFSLPNKAIGLPDQEKGGSIVPETPNVALRPVSHSAIGSSREAIPNPLTPISIKSSGSASAVKAGGGAKQPKRLLQVLNNGNNTGDDNSGSKDSTSVDVPHIEDHAREAAAALNQHAGLLPGAKRLVAKAHLSKDALKHIFSIGNADVHDYEEVRVDNAVAEPASHDDSIHQDPVHNPTRRHTYQAVSSSLVSVAAAAVTPLRVVTTRRSRVSMSIDFPVDNNVGSDVAAGRERYSSQMDSAVPRRAESKTRKAKLPWLRRRRDGDRRTPSPENSLDDDGDIFASGPRSHGSSRMFDDSAIGMEDDSRMPSRASSTIISRTMSLTAQLERTLSMKLLFPRLSRPSTSDDNSTRPRAPDEQHPSPSLPSPLFAEAMAMQRRAMTPEGAVTPSPPVSIRMQQIRPSMLRVPPPLRSRSTPPGEAGMRSASRPVSQDSLFSASSRPYIDYDDTDFIASVLVSSPPPITSPSRQVDAKWEVHTDHGISAISSLPSQRQRNSCEGQSRGNSIDYASAHDKRGSMHQSRSNSMVTSRGQYAGTASQDGYGLQRSLSRMDPHIASMDGGGDGGQAEDVRLLRHRASYDGYSNGPRQTWDAGSYGPPQYNPPRMSNGYTGPVPAVGPYGSGRRRSGSGSSSHGDIYQLQQQQAWDFYYQQYTRPPPSFPRGAHQRNRSMGSRFGPVPGPQAPYRILHSYNSPAYRGVPIWG